MNAADFHRLPPSTPLRPRRTAARDALVRFLRGEDGTTAVEYAVMLALILATIFGTIGSVGGATGGLFESSQSQLSDVGF